MRSARSHVLDPVPILQECDRILKPGGWIVIVVPNITSLFFKWLGHRWSNLSLPYHFHHFSPDSLRQAFQKISLQKKQLNTETVIIASELALITWVGYHLFIPTRLSSKLHLFSVPSKSLAQYADRMNQEDAIIALFQK